MTWSLLGRLFGLPLVIIGVIVCSAMIVVLSFGAPAATQQRGLDELLLALESGSGRKNMGLLLPRDKEHWQAGLELTKRLETKDREFTEADLETVADRVGVMVRAELADIAQREDGRGAVSVPHGSQAGPARLDFLVRALGLTERPGVIGVLDEVVGKAPDHYAMLAMLQLGGLGHVPGASETVGTILARLTDAKSSPELRLMACTVLSVLANASDHAVIDALATTHVSTEDREVAWSAALALARLGSAKGKSTLMDLLDRSFWEQDDRYQRVDDKGVVRRYRMPGNRVDDALAATVDAAAHLRDPDLWRLIERLQFDPSPTVKRRAAEALRIRDRRAELED